jgi:hypothetical protein
LSLFSNIFYNKRSIQFFEISREGFVFFFFFVVISTIIYI